MSTKLDRLKKLMKKENDSLKKAVEQSKASQEKLENYENSYIATLRDEYSISIQDIEEAFKNFKKQSENIQEKKSEENQNKFDSKTFNNVKTANERR